MPVSGGATPPWSEKMSALICLKLVRMFLSVIITPAGVRVDPDVYCRYTVSAELSPFAARAFPESRSSKSTSMTDGAGLPGSRLDVLGEIACDRRCRENDSGCYVTHHRTNALIAGAAERNRKGNGGKSGLDGAKKRNDVVKPLRRQNDRAVTSRAAKPELLGKVQGSPVQLRPRQGFRNAVPIVFVINITEGCIVGLQTSALAQHSGNRKRHHWVTLPLVGQIFSRLPRMPPPAPYVVRNDWDRKPPQRLISTIPLASPLAPSRTRIHKRRWSVPMRQRR